MYPQNSFFFLNMGMFPKENLQAPDILDSQNFSKANLKLDSQISSSGQKFSKSC